MLFASNDYSFLRSASEKARFTPLYNFLLVYIALSYSFLPFRCAKTHARFCTSTPGRFMSIFSHFIISTVGAVLPFLSSMLHICAAHISIIAL